MVSVDLTLVRNSARSFLCPAFSYSLGVDFVDLNYELRVSVDFLFSVFLRPALLTMVGRASSTKGIVDRGI